MFAPQKSVYSDASVGTSHGFYVEDSNGAWITETAKLQKIGAYCKIWIADKYFSGSTPDLSHTNQKLTQAQVNAIADKFDAIYAKETAVFGFEYGGGPSGNGGVDEDSKIQILIYDIDYDYSAAQTGGTFGFFWAKDEFDQSSLSGNIKTNKAEIFYIDSHFADLEPGMIYSTLIHEFQHMINFNEKYLNHGLNSDVWYNEMLSMLAEDLLDPFITISALDDAHPIASRIPLFLGDYDITGPASAWLGGTRVYNSYSNAYAFGAYLARNFGGAKLVELMAKNSSVDIASISAALAACVDNLTDVSTFQQALSRYGEALVYTNTVGDTLSFNKTVTSNIGIQPYVFSGFDVWDMNYRWINAAGNIVASVQKGPFISNPDSPAAMPAYTVCIQSKDAWKNKTGSLSITVQKPAVPNVDVYLMVK
jgi:hypothetical protein